MARSDHACGSEFEKVRTARSHQRRLTDIIINAADWPLPIVVYLSQAAVIAPRCVPSRPADDVFDYINGHSPTVQDKQENVLFIAQVRRQRRPRERALVACSGRRKCIYERTSAAAASTSMPLLWARPGLDRPNVKTGLWRCYRMIPVMWSGPDQFFIIVTQFRELIWWGYDMEGPRMVWDEMPARLLHVIFTRVQRQICFQRSRIQIDLFIYLFISSNNKPWVHWAV